MQQTREHVIERVKRRLLRKGAPRLLMMLILLLTGAAGFAVSFSLLRLGLTRMWLRYPIAILLAYCVFLLLLRLWLFYQSRGHGPELEDADQLLDLMSSEGTGDIAELADLIPSGGGSGGNFEFGGGGAGGSWGESVSSAPKAIQSSGGGGGSGGFGFDLDLDEGWLIVLAIIAILGGIIASLYVIYIAPALLAEILVDGLLVAGLYKRLKGVEQRNWLGTAVRKTLLPALIVALFFSIGGYLFQKAVPAARSIGEVWTSRTPE